MSTRPLKQVVYRCSHRPVVTFLVQVTYEIECKLEGYVLDIQIFRQSLKRIQRAVGVAELDQCRIWNRKQWSTDECENAQSILRPFNRGERRPENDYLLSIVKGLRTNQNMAYRMTFKLADVVARHSR